MKRGKKIRSGLGKAFDMWWGAVQNWTSKEGKAYRDHVANMQKLGKPVELSPDHHFHRPTDWKVVMQERAAAAMQKSIDRLKKAKERREKAKEVRQATTPKNVRFTSGV